MNLTISSTKLISAIGSVALFFGGYFLKDLRDGMQTLRVDFKADHDILVQLHYKDEFLNGKVKAAPVADVKPLSTDVALAAMAVEKR